MYVARMKKIVRLAERTKVEKWLPLQMAGCRTSVSKGGEKWFGLVWLTGTICHFYDSPFQDGRPDIEDVKIDRMRGQFGVSGTFLSSK